MAIIRIGRRKGAARLICAARLAVAVGGYVDGRALVAPANEGTSPAQK
jgi:hypothetical protein